MAFPATDLPDPSTWFSNTLITSALMKSNIIDPINLLPRGQLGKATSSSSVTLSTTSAFAGLAPVTFVLTSQRRVKITVQVRYTQAGAVNVRFGTQAGYNSGSSATIGSFTAASNAPFSNQANTTQPVSGLDVGDVLLAAGTYTAYASVLRGSGGSATDVADRFYTLVEDIGAT